MPFVYRHNFCTQIANMSRIDDVDHGNLRLIIPYTILRFSLIRLDVILWYMNTSIFSYYDLSNSIYTIIMHRRSDSWLSTLCDMHLFDKSIVRVIVILASNIITAIYHRKGTKS